MQMNVINGKAVKSGPVQCNKKKTLIILFALMLRIIFFQHLVEIIIKLCFVYLFIRRGCIPRLLILVEIRNDYAFTYQPPPPPPAPPP